MSSEHRTDSQPIQPSNQDKRLNAIDEGKKLPRSLIVISIGTLAIIFIGVIVLVVSGANHTFDIKNLSATGETEEVMAQADHDVIRTIGYLCGNSTGSGKITVPSYLLTMAAGDPAPKAAAQEAPQPAPPSMSLEEPSYILAAIFLSHRIAWGRIAFAEEERWYWKEAQVFQWGLVMLGAITTVLVSIRSMSIQGRFHNLIGMLAIVSSALLTAMTTMNAFYAPRVAYERNGHALQALQTLHRELATGMTRESVCNQPAKPWPNDWRFKRIQALADRYEAVMNSAQAPVPSTPEDDGQNQSPTPTPPKGSRQFSHPFGRRKIARSFPRRRQLFEATPPRHPGFPRLSSPATPRARRACSLPPAHARVTYSRMAGRPLKRQKQMRLARELVGNERGREGLPASWDEWSDRRRLEWMLSMNLTQAAHVCTWDTSRPESLLPWQWSMWDRVRHGLWMICLRLGLDDRQREESELQRQWREGLALRLSGKAEPKE
jgi:hypothetical protein